MKELNDIIIKALKRKPCLKRAYGIVTAEVIKEDGKTTGKFKVRITHNQEEIHNIQYAIQHGISIDASNDLTLVNKTIELEDDVLKPGDLVWVHYWNTISDGIIAMKVGASNLVSKPESRPWHRTAIITDAYVIVPYGTE